MSLADIESRIGAIQAQIQALSGTASAGAATTAGSFSAQEFANTLAAQSADGSAAYPSADLTSGGTLASEALSVGALPAGSPAGGVLPGGVVGGVVSGPVGAAPTTGGSSSGPTAAAVLNTARKFLGVPYVWGGESPSGFDCSGLVQYVFAKNDITLPRVAADQATKGVRVPPADARPGDLLFFGNPVDHVGIYAGNNTMIVAPHTGASVRVEQVDPASTSVIRRVLPTTTTAYAAGAVTSATASGRQPAWAAALPGQGQRFAGAITQAAAAAGVDPRLLAALVWSESDFDPSSVSPAGAIGLTQLMPGTARGLGVDPTNPDQNLLGGARYLSTQLRKFGSPALALAAYNAGPSAVVKYGGVPPYAETQAYVRVVLDRFQKLGGGAS